MVKSCNFSNNKSCREHLDGCRFDIQELISRREVMNAGVDASMH